MKDRKTIKSALESMMFVWGRPLDSKTCAGLLGVSVDQVVDCFLELKNEYEREGRGILIRRINQSFQFVTAAGNKEYIEKLCTPVKVKRFTQSALEVLAIIAYRQPVTKGEIDGIRGIKCDRVVDGLLKKNLIRAEGRSDGPGKPMLYATTDVFLKQFGFSSLKDLPEIGDIESAAEPSWRPSELPQEP